MTDQPTSLPQDGEQRGKSRESSANWLQQMPSLARILSVAVLILGIIVAGALFYKVMAGFFVPLFLAALLVVIFRPVHTWILHRVGMRHRTAAIATTALVLFMVLMPVFLLVSIAATEFTSMVGNIKFNDLSEQLELRRKQLGISLPHPEQFRRLDLLADRLDEPQTNDSGISHEDELRNIDEALQLVRFLQAEVDGPGEAAPAEEDVEEKLIALRSIIEEHSDGGSDELFVKLNAEEQFHRQAVIASAAIRTWMRTLLGGTFRSQIRLLANPSAEVFRDLLSSGREALQPRFFSLTSATGSVLFQLVIGLVVMVIAVYFFLLDGHSMTQSLMRMSPLDDRYEERLLLEFDRTSRAVVLASVLSALVQGLLAALAYYVLDFEGVILLFLITTLMALVPFLGAASVWVPCVIFLGLVEQRWGAAIGLAIYGATIVSSIDNVIKVYVLHGRSTIHPLVALLSILGGVKVFGPIGILVGPMVVAFLQTLLEILNHELAGRSPEEATAVSGETNQAP